MISLAYSKGRHRASITQGLLPFLLQFLALIVAGIGAPEQEVARSSPAGPTPERRPRLHFGAGRGSRFRPLPAASRRERIAEPPKVLGSQVPRDVLTSRRRR